MAPTAQGRTSRTGILPDHPAHERTVPDVGVSVSFREIRLVAAARPSQAWAVGERVTRSSRTYQVEAIQDPPHGDPEERPGYVHLRPWPEDAGASRSACDSRNA